MKSHVFRGAAYVLASSALLAISCGKQPLPSPQPYPVSGSVMYRGQPAQKVRIAFVPVQERNLEPGKKRLTAAAMTDERGEFHVSSYKPGDGAPAGEYLVTFVWPDHINTGDEPDPVPEVDQFKGFYADPQKSQFRVTIKEGENTLPPFALQ